MERELGISYFKIIGVVLTILSPFFSWGFITVETSALIYTISMTMKFNIFGYATEASIGQFSYELPISGDFPLMGFGGIMFLIGAFFCCFYIRINGEKRNRTLSIAGVIIAIVGLVLYFMFLTLRVKDSIAILETAPYGTMSLYYGFDVGTYLAAGAVLLFLLELVLNPDERWHVRIKI